VKLIAWNLGPAASAEIAQRITEHSADIIVLSPHRTRQAQEVAKGLRAAGWLHSIGTPAAGTIAIFARESLEERGAVVSLPPFTWWGAEAWLRSRRLTVVAINATLPGFMNSLPDAHREFWNILGGFAKRRLADRVIIIGNLHTFPPWLPDAPNPIPWLKLERSPDPATRLVPLGWLELSPLCSGHDQINPDQPHDRAFATPSLATAVARCLFLHEEAKLGYSTGPILLIEINETALS
jgi:hypothetical protein